MGIKGLNSWISANFKGVMVPADSVGGVSYDHVLFDFNGIVHQACRRRGSEKEVIKTVISELDALLRVFGSAAKTVLIALDGPGPTAKLMEQRKRRIDKVLKAGRDAEALIPGSKENLRRIELARLEGRPPPAPKTSKKRSFDSLQVTPGTLFMLRLRRALEWYSASRSLGVAGVFSGRPRPTILVSAADVYGEGELKLLQHVHAVRRDAALSGASPSFLLVGPDADLLLLGLAAGTPRTDVLTTDANGRHQLFRVAVLCSAFVRQLTQPQSGARRGAVPAGSDGSAGIAFTAGAAAGYSTIAGANSAAGSVPRVCEGGLLQLDFLVVAFLQGNDYLVHMHPHAHAHASAATARSVRVRPVA